MRIAMVIFAMLLGNPPAAAAPIDWHCTYTKVCFSEEQRCEKVKDFELWSLDWTPKGRAGMETELVGVSGEQVKEEGVTREEVIASLKLEDVPEHVATALRAEGRSEVANDIAIAGEMRVIFDLGDEADSEAVITAVRGIVEADRAGKLDKAVDEAIDGAEIKAEMVQAAVKDIVLPKLSSTSSKEEITGEITAALDLPYVKELAKGSTAPVVNGGTKTEGDRKATRWE
jgi:hypothetical protein